MSNRLSFQVCRAAVLVLFMASAANAQFQFNKVYGHARFEKIKGQPSVGYIELYETNLFLSHLDDGQLLTKGVARRLGTTDYSVACYTSTYADGSYCIDAFNGTYTILVDEPLFFVAPKVVSNVTMANGIPLELNIELPIDFSTWDKSSWTTPDNPWYQTFVATGVSIRGIAFSYAGPDPDGIAAAILEDNGDPNPANWTFIGDRTDYVVNDQGDNWVRFRSVEIPTTPGTKYAVRLTGGPNPGVNPAGNIQPYKLGKGPFSYPTADGQAYNSAGVAQNFDLNVTVFSDNDGTVVTMNKRTEGIGTLKDPDYFGMKWGQTFVAQGASLAAVEVKAAGAAGKWEIDFRWKIFDGADANGPTGPQIGPTKLSEPAWNAFAFHQAVAYNPDQVPLTAGQTYFIQFEAVNPPSASPGFNPYIMNDDVYNGGHGYWWTGSAWDDRPNDDVNMTILEYLPTEPIIEVQPSEINRTVIAGTGVPGSDSFTVSNIGAGAMSYNVSESASWFDVDPTSGSSSGEADPIDVNYNNGVVSGLAIGVYVETITVTAGGASNTPQLVTVNLHVESVPADFDEDTDVDMDDYAHLQECFTGDGTRQDDPACQDALLDGDDDVDDSDLSLFMDCLSGADVIADPGCVSP